MVIMMGIRYLYGNYNNYIYAICIKNKYMIILKVKYIYNLKHKSILIQIFLQIAYCKNFMIMV